MRVAFLVPRGRSHGFPGSRHGRRSHRPQAAAPLPRRLQRAGRSMIGSEPLADPAADRRAVREQVGDIARLNAWFGGTSAVVDALRPYLARARGEFWTALDVGAGSGDILRAVIAAAEAAGVRL